MKNSSYSNNIIKSDYVKVKGTVSLNYFNFKEKEELPVNEEVEDHNEKRLELLRLEEKINQKLIDAQIKYDEILNQANTESEKILAETNQKAVEIEKRAYHEGYEQGTQNGYEDGYKEAYEDNIEKAKNESSEIIDKANKIMLEANNQVASYIKNNKKNILAMGISIAEKVLRRNFEDEESMDLLILDVIKEYELKENFVIRVNPIYKESLDKVNLLDTDDEETNQKKKISYLTLNWFMQTLLDRSDRMAMYNGFELRVPFCDYRLAQYVWNIPWEIKALNGREKGLLRYISR